LGLGFGFRIWVEELGLGLGFRIKVQDHGYVLGCGSVTSSWFLVVGYVVLVLD
jgi:hypothetical protein